MSKDSEEFKNENRRNWKINSDYWLNNPLRQVEDTKHFFKAKLQTIVKEDFSIVDMGCGSGWLLDFLLELNIPFKYIGLDFNPNFISHLEERYGALANVCFELVDFEKKIPTELIGVADIVFNCFNFFESLDLTTTFRNAVRILKPSGTLVIFTIEPLYLALAISSTMKDFKELLRVYELMKSRGESPHFFQNIDLGESESKDLKYASVLYSLADFFKQAQLHQMQLIDYGEVIKTSKPLPKTYQYISFKK
jgi:SAM-dependent methyltransferase